MDLTTLSSLRACRTLKTVVKRKFFTSPIDPFVTSCVSDAQNCGKTSKVQLKRGNVQNKPGQAKLQNSHKLRQHSLHGWGNDTCIYCPKTKFWKTQSSQFLNFGRSLTKEKLKIRFLVYIYIYIYRFRVVKFFYLL